MPDLDSPIIYAIPGFVILIIAEMLLGKSGKGYEAKDTAISLLMGTGSQLAGLLTIVPIVVIANMVHEFALFDIGYAWWIWPICFVLDDLAYYVFHRSAHRVGAAGTGPRRDRRTEPRRRQLDG